MTTLNCLLEYKRLNDGGVFLLVIKFGFGFLFALQYYADPPRSLAPTLPSFDSISIRQKLDSSNDSTHYLPPLPAGIGLA